MAAETPQTATRAPNGLGTGGKRLWKSVVSEYELRPDELEILRRCARMVDRIETIDSVLADVELVTEGSRGQQRAHPLLVELRGIEAELGRLLRGLALPDDANVGSVGQRRSSAAREMARARWGL